MSEEISSLYVTIGADFSQLETALHSTQGLIMGLGAGLLGNLPLRTEEQAQQMISRLQGRLALLPGVLQASLEAPFNAALGSLRTLIAARMGEIVGQINAALHQINHLMTAAGSSGGIGPQTGGIQAGRAEGGAVSSGSLYLVGERGPELFLPSTSGTIIPNHALGGGVSITGGTFILQGIHDPESLFDQLRQVAAQRGA